MMVRIPCECLIMQIFSVDLVWLVDEVEITSKPHFFKDRNMKVIYMKTTLKFLTDRGVEVRPSEGTEIRDEESYVVLTDKKQEANGVDI